MSEEKPSFFASLFTKQFRTLGVVAMISLAQGIVSCCDVVWNYVYKLDFKLEPAQSSFFDSTLALPWTFKPLWGVLSDNLPIFGMRRKPYLIIMVIIAWAALLSFGLWVPSVELGFVILLMLNISQSFQSVVAQAIIVQNAQELAQKKNVTDEEKTKAASSGVSIFFGTKFVGRALYSVFIMFFLTEEGRRPFLFNTSFVPLVLLMASFFLPEKRAKKSKARVSQNPIRSIIGGPHEPLIEGAINLNAANQSMAQGAGGMSNFRRAWLFIKNPLIYKSMLLIFLANFAPASAQTKFYYFTNHLGFEASFMGSLRLLSCTATVLGVVVYNKYFCNVKLRKFYTCANIFYASLTLSLLILIFRLNVKVGIPDKVFATFDTFVTDFGGELSALPVLVMACKICPKNIEATVFALMIAVNNIAGNLSGQLGALLVYALGITAENFDHLWITTVVTAVCQLSPLVVIWIIDYDKAIKQIEEENRKLDQQFMEANNEANDEVVVISHDTTQNNEGEREEGARAN